MKARVLTVHHDREVAGICGRPDVQRQAVLPDSSVLWVGIALGTGRGVLNRLTDTAVFDGRLRRTPAILVGGACRIPHT